MPAAVARSTSASDRRGSSRSSSSTVPLSSAVRSRTAPRPSQARSAAISSPGSSPPRHESFSAHRCPPRRGGERDTALVAADTAREIAVTAERDARADADTARADTARAERDARELVARVEVESRAVVSDAARNGLKTPPKPRARNAPPSPPSSRNSAEPSTPPATRRVRPRRVRPVPSTSDDRVQDARGHRPGNPRMAGLIGSGRQGKWAVALGYTSGSSGYR